MSNPGVNRTRDLELSRQARYPSSQLGWLAITVSGNLLIILTRITSYSRVKERGGIGSRMIPPTVLINTEVVIASKRGCGRFEERRGG